MENSQDSRGPGKNKKNWTTLQDKMLIDCLVEFHNEGLYHADNGFKPGALKEMEARLELKMPGCGLKGKPHIESRMKTLKAKWSAIHDLLCGRDSSGFGWDPETKCVTAENDVWDSYVPAHPKSTKMRQTPFPYYDDLCVIWAKDRATGRNAETPADVVEELMTEEASNVAEEFVGLDDITTPMPFSEGNSNEGNSKSCKKRKSRESDSYLVTAMEKAAKLFSEKMEQSSSLLSKAIGLDITDKQMRLYGELEKVHGLTIFEQHKAGCMIASDVSKINLFFSLPDDQRKEWVNALLLGHFGD